VISGWLLLAACTVDPSDSQAPADNEPPGDSQPVDSGDSEPEDSGDPPDEQGFAVLSLNLHCLETGGTEYSTNTDRFAAIAEAVVAEGVQVIALQELCETSQESASALLEQALEDASGLAWSLTTTFAHVGWEGTADEADEYVGLAVQGSFLQEREIEFHVQDGLRRVGVLGRWDAGFAHIAVSSLHLDHQHAAARLGQARQAAVEALVTASSAHSLVLGDFNATPGSPATLAMQAMGFEDLGADLNDDRIDYVWAHRGAPVALAGFERIFTGERWPEVSDHPGMLARLIPRQPVELSLTTVTTQHDAAGRYLAVRGDASPLSWDAGWPVSADGDRWTAVFTQLDAPFEYKWLLDDADWQTGDNLQGQPGQSNDQTVSFE